MTNTKRIALDLMGGDFGPDVILAAADIVRQRHRDVSFLGFGEEAIAKDSLKQFPKLGNILEFRHCSVSVAMDAKPSQALRAGRKDSSMWRAVEAVRDGDAGVAVSAGNTGALMAMSTLCLRTMPGVSRPAMAAIWPTLRSESIVLDVGATIGVNADQLVVNALIGGALARVLFSIERPTVGLLNIGAEEVKGLDEVRAAGRRLRNSEFPMFKYFGFVEGDDIGKGTTDVVVTEGFAGNIALKAAEGTANQIGQYLRLAMRRTVMARIGSFFAQGAFQFLKEKMDPRKVNGGILLGLNGLVVKSHGGADAEGVAAAIDLAFDMASADLQKKLTLDLKRTADLINNVEVKEEPQ